MKDISIIIPVYNGEQTISRTLASLISNRDYIKEIIVVDDHSTDKTVKTVKQFFRIFKNIQIVKSSGYRNPGIARKTGMLKATGRWITFIDADDCLTPSSLKYVYNKLSIDTTLLCTQTIYYESGTFNPESIDFSDFSCGGNFYYRAYLINNNLFPDDDIKLVEDEYFNEKVIKFIELNGGEIEHFEYPVYEVHHDIDEYTSYAIANWVDYCCKYRLLYKQILTDDFWDLEDRDKLKTEYIENFIFCFFLAEGIMADPAIEFSLIENGKYFKKAIRYFESKFNDSYETIIEYFEKQKDSVESIRESAVDSIGSNFRDNLNFDYYVRFIA